MSAAVRITFVIATIRQIVLLYDVSQATQRERICFETCARCDVITRHNVPNRRREIHTRWRLSQIKESP